MLKLRQALLLSAMALLISACFYPPATQSLKLEQKRTELHIPYDQAWDALKIVIRDNGLRIRAEDPNNGLIEAEGRRFSSRDADCGKIKSVVGFYPVEPGLESSSVYNFKITPIGTHSSAVQVDATFNSPLSVPLHQTQDVACASRGAAESHLLKDLLAEAIRVRKRLAERGRNEAQETAASSAHGRSTLLAPDRLP